MIKFMLILMIPALVFAQQPKHLGTLLKVYPDGTVSPTNATPYFSEIAALAAQVQANLTEASIVMQLANIASNRADEIEAIISQREGIVYLRGGVESFEPAGIVHNTNIVASIIKFKHETTPSNIVASVYTYFTEDPGNNPYTRVTRNLANTNTWELAENEKVQEDQVLIGSTLYDCYRNDVFLPLSYSNANFRVFADVQGVGTNQPLFNIHGGLKMGEYTGMTVTIVDGTNTFKWVGGPLVQ